MANIKAAIKNIRTIERQTIANKHRRTSVKTYTKKFEDAINAGEIDKAKELIKVIDKKLKKAAHHNIIHKNAASRRLSRLTKKLNNAM